MSSPSSEISVRMATGALPAIAPGYASPAAAAANTQPPYPVHRFTVAQYDELGRLGILTEDDNVELLEGWIVPKMTKHPLHDGTIDLVQYLLARTLPSGWYVRAQNVVVTADSEPEPDIAVVRGRPGDHRQRHPTGTEVGLVIEVAESTVARDRRKAGIYARAGIPHYWIVNLDQRQVETFSQPAEAATEASYSSRQVLRGNDETLTIILDGAAQGTLALREFFS